MALHTSSRGSEYQGVEMVSHNAPKRDKSPGPSENCLGPVEYRKVGINVKRKMSFLWALVLLAPVAVSFAILQLSFQMSYWASRSSTRDCRAPWCLPNCCQGARDLDTFLAFQIDTLLFTIAIEF